MGITVPIIAVLAPWLVRALDTAQQDVTMNGMKCGGASEQGGVIVFPTNTSRKYPLISFAHGFGVRAKVLETHYKPFWRLIASAGYIIAAQSAPTFRWDRNASLMMGYCMDEWKDQLQVLRWARNASEVKNRIDFETPSILMGHSMGGRATVMSASQASTIKSLNVGTAVAQHPSVNFGGCPGCAPAVPILFTSGSEDVVVPPMYVKTQYNSTKGVAKAYIEMKGTGHLDPEDGEKNLQDHYILAWLNCYIKQNASACTLIKCNEPQTSSPTTTCEYEGLLPATATAAGTAATNYYESASTLRHEMAPVSPLIPILAIPAAAVNMETHAKEGVRPNKLMRRMESESHPTASIVDRGGVESIEVANAVPFLDNRGEALQGKSNTGSSRLPKDKTHVLMRRTASNSLIQ